MCDHLVYVTIWSSDVALAPLCSLSSETFLRDSCLDCNFDFQLRCQMLENALFLKTRMCLKTHLF